MKGERNKEVRLSELVIVLATYNEASNLPTLVVALEGLGLDLDLLVVDDNSPDGTQQVAQQLSTTFGNISVISRPGKLGLGSALCDGMRAALATEARYIMTMDADCSHDPLDVPRLLNTMRRGEADLVQGSRYIRGGGCKGWGPRRWLLSRMANLFYHWCAGAPHESTTNFRVFSRRAASIVLAKARSRDYEFMPEAALLVLAAGLRVREIPIVFTDRVRGQSKLGRRQVVKAVMSCISTSLQYRLHLGRFVRRAAE
jgi:dolichol-phosphate mannosyltransferase